jgi:hypothetical protein
MKSLGYTVHNGSRYWFPVYNRNYDYFYPKILFATVKATTKTIPYIFLELSARALHAMRCSFVQKKFIRLQQVPAQFTPSAKSVCVIERPSGANAEISPFSIATETCL